MPAFLLHLLGARNLFWDLSRYLIGELARTERPVKVKAIDRQDQHTVHMKSASNAIIALALIDAFNFMSADF